MRVQGVLGDAGVWVVGVRGWASLPSSKYRPLTPSSSGEVASRTGVAAPCCTVFQGSWSRMPLACARARSSGLVWRASLVWTTPGMTALTVMPSRAHWFVASTATRKLEVALARAIIQHESQHHPRQPADGHALRRA